MHNTKYKINSFENKNPKLFTKRHHEIAEALERLLEKGVPELTMSQIAKRLKISLRTVGVAENLILSP